MAKRGLASGGKARVTSAHRQIEVTVIGDDRVRPSVVSTPHGGGGGRGANVNVLTSLSTDRQSINVMPILSGFEVEVEALAKACLPAARRDRPPPSRSAA